jgi:cytidylate kinase
LKNIIVAIDGYSSCGKSTLAKQLAKELNYHYVDTGAMYRALTLYLIRNQIDIHHPNMVAEALPNINIGFGLNQETQEQFTLLNGENIENEIGNNKGIVMDGRDIGTVVFPDAELKLFITAEPNIRAQRRLDELKEKGQNTTFEEVLANLAKRDHIDCTRADSPLLKAEDAIEIDNSYLSKEEQLSKVLNLFHGAASN